MKILFISQYFYPETFRGNDIAFDCQSRGNDVTVICGTPNYPQGKFFKGYNWFRKHKEVINGVKVIRVPIIPRGKGGALMLLLNYFSYMIVGGLYAVYLAIFKKYDCVFIQQLSPVLMSVPGIIYKKLRAVPLYVWVLDLWPESLMSAGNINNRTILSFFNWFAKLQYKNATKILISSKSFSESINKKGDFSSKIIYFPNWAEDVFTKEDTCKNFQMPNLPAGFKVMFAGNIGEAQDFDHLMESALKLKEKKDIQFIFIGDGRKKRWVEDYIEEHQLRDTVHLLGRYPIETMPSFFEKADAMIVSLKNELIFNLTAPAKIQAYMSAKKPIIGMISGEGNTLIKEAKCGIAVEAGDTNSFTKAIKQLKEMDDLCLKEMGSNGFIFCQSYFNKESCMNNLNKILEDSI